MKTQTTTFTQKKDLDKIPTHLPLLNYVSKVRSLEKNLPFRGHKILAVQHLLGSTIPFFAMLEKGGAKPNDIHIVGKAYSSHPLVVKTLQKKGYRLTFEDVFDCIENQPYDTVLEKHIINSTTTLLEGTRKIQKGLIIDDGGKAIKLLHQKYQHLANRFTCVEQTSRGARTVNTIKQPLCPIINVARSDAKTLYESPVIAKIMVDEFINSLEYWKKAGAFQLKNKKVLLLGYGFIGENVAKELLGHGFNISVYDPNNNQLEKAKKLRFATVKDLHKTFKKIGVLIGCSGMPVIKDKEFQMLKPAALLVNMASTDMEFSAWDLRPKGEIIYQHILPSDLKYFKKHMPLPWRSLYKIQLAKTYIYLANGGFPIDFSGKINPIPADDIQLTSSLLLGGAIQAVLAKKQGLINLDSKLQKNIVIEYLKLKSQK